MDSDSYVANLLTCARMLLSPPNSKVLGSPRQQALCRQSAHLWATIGMVLRSEVLGNPLKRSVLCSEFARLRATADFVPRLEAFGNPVTATIM